MINLLKNSIKFTHQGSIWIKAWYDANSSSLIVSVKDTGAGIAEEDMSKLFVRFSKLKRTEEINTCGIGLGLTIVEQILEQIGGSITVKSDGV